MTKKRILVCSENSLSASGYSRISKEILTRLHKEERFELLELAAFMSANDPRIDTLPWSVIPCIPDKEDHKANAEYFSHQCNVNGRHIFNQVCLDFLPDTIIALKDFWYEPYLHTYPFRKHYNLVWYYPCDAEPLRPEWVDNIVDCEAVFTYTDWGHELLKKQCGTRGNVVGSMPLGVDKTKFYPIFNKKKVKEYFNFSNDSLVVGFVARNQPRKLFDDVFQAFVLFLQNAPADIASKTYLYVHTAYPDIGWDIPHLLMEYGLGNKVLFSYFCKSCQDAFPSVYSDVTQICKKCNNSMASLPRPEDSMPDDLLNLIYNFCDLYIQVALNEGLGIPPSEAMCCAVPTCVINYSGMTEFIKYCDGISLDVLRLNREPDSNRLVAVPNIVDITNKLIELMSLPHSIRKRIGFNQYQKAAAHFDWDKSLTKLVNVLDNLPNKGWGQPSRLHTPERNIPNEVTNEQFVNWAYHNIIGRPELLSRYDVQRKIHALATGIGGTKPHFSAYNKDVFLHECFEDNSFYNNWEAKRLERMK